MEDKATKRGGGAAVVLVLVAVLVVLPILYVLSLGPIVYLVGNGAISPSLYPAVATVYWPLDWIANNVPQVGPAIVWYAERWRTAPPVAMPAAAPVPAPSGS
jgi:hypothetical protein